MNDPTLDPVELERRLRAEAARSERREERTDSLTPLSWLAIFVSITLVGVYLVVWANAVQGSGGPEAYVRATDFVPVFAGGRILREGRGPLLYDPETQRRELVRFSSVDTPQRFDRTPFEALLVAPLTALPPWVGFALWTLLAGLALGLAVGLMDGALPVSRTVGWAMSLAACSYLPAIRALMLGQNSLFVLTGLCGTYLALKRSYQGWAAVSLLLVALRPQLLPVVLLVLLLQGYRRTVGWFVALLALLVAGVMPVLGTDWPLRYLQFLLHPPDRADWVPGVGNPVFLALSAVSVVALIWAGLRSRRVSIDEELVPYEEPVDLVWALTGLVAALTTIYLNPQDLTLLIFPAWILGAYATLRLWSEGLSRLWLVLLWAGYALAPLTLYWTSNGTSPALAVLPTVVLLAMSIALLAWQTAALREEGYG
ncbi:MAG: glycosyltransferase 87 family protein [Chloroflexia bacterium]